MDSKEVQRLKERFKRLGEFWMEAYKYTGLTRIQYIAEYHPDPEVRADMKAWLDQLDR